MRREVGAPTVELHYSPRTPRSMSMKVFGEEDQVIQVVMIFDDGIDL